ncbi:MAG: hypothetical protein Q4F70_01910 [Clostridia bacterium]|nr:hypothetical protein [Clostridia bacterium]
MSEEQVVAESTPEKKKKSKKKIALIVVISIVVLLLVIYLVFFALIHINSSEYYKTAEKEFIIPGLGDGFVPQGITFDDKSSFYLVCGYMSNDEAARIYMVDPDTNDFSFISLNDVDGKPDKSHICGIATYGRFAFVTTGEKVNVFRLADINNPDYNVATPIDSFDSDNIPAFCYVVNDTLYVGEFYRSKSYETPESHHIQTDTGEYQMAIMTVFDANELTAALSSKGAIDDVAPKAIYSIQSGAQGMCILKGGQICISSSWGLSTSHVTIYDDPMKSNLTADDKFTIESGKEIPLYYLSQENVIKDYKLPAMAEELALDGDKVLIMNESASNKYFFGKLIGGKYCYSFLPEY